MKDFIQEFYYGNIDLQAHRTGNGSCAVPALPSAGLPPCFHM